MRSLKLTTTVLLAACTPTRPASTETGVRLPVDFVVTDVDAEASPVLISGHIRRRESESSSGHVRGSGYRSSPSLFAASSAQSPPLWGRTEVGRVDAAARRGADIWLAWGRPNSPGYGSHWTLLHSRDGGATWEDRGPIPADGIDDVVVADADVLWVHGANTLLRTEDDGRLWREIDAPGDLGPQQGPVVALSRDVALITEPVLQRTDNGGWTWRQLDDAETSASDGRFVAGPFEGGLRIGDLREDGIRWFASTSEAQGAASITSDGDRYAVLAHPTGSRAYSGLVRVYGTRRDPDVGVQWFPSRSNVDWAALQGVDGLVYVDQGRRVVWVDSEHGERR